jgi:hypothetical protein
MGEQKEGGEPVMELDSNALKEDLLNLSLPEIFQVLETSMRVELEYEMVGRSEKFKIVASDNQVDFVEKRKKFFRKLRVEIEDHIIWLYQVKRVEREEDGCVQGSLQDV